ncbi:MAG: PilZ domain-containing protein [Bdellovibrionota bacterium]
MLEKHEWYLPDKDGSEPTGPFTTEQLVERIRKGELRADDFTWGFHLEGQKWQRFADIAEFKEAMVGYPRCGLPRKKSRGLLSQQRAVKLKSTQEGQYGIENIYRRFPRAPLAAEVIVHNEKNYYVARCIDISEKGVSIRLENFDLFEKGEEVVVTIRNAPGLGTVSARSVVLRTLRDTAAEAYGLYFLRLNPVLRRKIAQYVIDTLRTSTEEQKAA